KKLLFMGAELAPDREWDHDSFLDWDLVERPANAGVGSWLARLNELYRSEPALHRMDADQRGFTWIDVADADASVFSMLRAPVPLDEVGPDDRFVMVVANLTPVPRHDYRIGVPAAATWRLVADSDAEEW